MILQITVDHFLLFKDGRLRDRDIRTFQKRIAPRFPEGFAKAGLPTDPGTYEFDREVFEQALQRGGWAWSPDEDGPWTRVWSRDEAVKQAPDFGWIGRPQDYGPRQLAELVDPEVVRATLAEATQELFGEEVELQRLDLTDAIARSISTELTRIVDKERV